MAESLQDRIPLAFLPPSGPNTAATVQVFNSYVYIVATEFSSVAQSCLTFCDPMNCSMPGLLVHHHLPECTQTHVHRVGDAIQPSHPLSSPFPPARNPSQHQSLFQQINLYTYCSFNISSSGAMDLMLCFLKFTC